MRDHPPEGWEVGPVNVIARMIKHRAERNMPLVEIGLQTGAVAQRDSLQKPVAAEGGVWLQGDWTPDRHLGVRRVDICVIRGTCAITAVRDLSRAASAGHRR